MSGFTSSVKALAIFLLVVGGATSIFLSFALSLNYLFSFFGPVPTTDKIIGYAVLAGPAPLIAGAALALFRKQRPGALLALAGSVILTAWMIIFYSKGGLHGLLLWEQLLWFVLVPVAVVATDIVACRIYKLTSAATAAK